MGQALLVNIDLDTGARILRILDEAGLKVIVAAWVHLEEYVDWRLVLSSRQFDEPGMRGAIRLVNQALLAAGFPMERKPPTLHLPTTDPFIRGLRRYFRTFKNLQVEGTRIGGQQFGNRWVEDGYVYRVS